MAKYVSLEKCETMVNSTIGMLKSAVSDDESLCVILDELHKAQITILRIGAEDEVK